MISFLSYPCSFTLAQSIALPLSIGILAMLLYGIYYNVCSAEKEYFFSTLWSFPKILKVRSPYGTGANIVKMVPQSSWLVGQVSGRASNGCTGNWIGCIEYKYLLNETYKQNSNKIGLTIWLIEMSHHAIAVNTGILKTICFKFKKKKNPNIERI